MQGHPEFDAELMLTIIELLDSKGLFTKMGYEESLEDIVATVKSQYMPPEGLAFSSLLDNIFIGKCMVALLLPTS